MPPAEWHRWHFSWMIASMVPAKVGTASGGCVPFTGVSEGAPAGSPVDEHAPTVNVSRAKTGTKASAARSGDILQR